MQQAKKVTIYTQVYKAEPYLKQCIESVLMQAYTNFEYILVDNASPDRCGEIIDHYAAQDKRIIPIHLARNQSPMYSLTTQYGTGDYFASIDADDWWEKDYLERLVFFLEENDLDLAITGSISHFEQDGSEKVLRKLNSPLALTRQQFARNYPELWTFPSTVWGNVMKMTVFEGFIIQGQQPISTPYGSDTLNMLKHLVLCDKIGIDNTAMYHYRIHPKSVSFQYNPLRFDGNILYYEAIREFLEQHNTFDEKKQEWLKQVHITSMNETLALLYESSLSVAEKAAECVRVAEHPLTAHALTADCDGRNKWYSLMHLIVSQSTGRATTKTEEKQIQKILQLVAPNCASAFFLKYRNLYAAESVL